MRTSPIGIDGVSLTWLAGEDGRASRVRVRVRDARGKYESATFPVESFGRDGKPNVPLEARAWAQKKRGHFLSGKALAGPASLDVAGRSFIEDARSRGMTPLYIRDLEITLAHAVAAPGMNNMGSSQFATACRRWLETAGTWHAINGPGGGTTDSGKEVSARTRNKRLQYLKTFTRHALHLGMVAHDPLAGFRKFKVSSEVKPTFTMDEIHATMTPKAKAHQYHLTWALLIYCGLRAQEALHLRWQDIDWKAGTITVRLQPGVYKLKRDKERILPLQGELRAILMPLAKPAGFIIERRTLDNKAHQRWFDEFLHSCGVEVGDRTPHSTRHTWVSLMMASGIASSIVKAWAGHQSIQTTDGYASAAAGLEPLVRHWKRGELELVPPVAEVEAAQ